MSLENNIKKIEIKDVEIRVFTCNDGDKAV